MTPLISTFANASARGFGGLRTFAGDTAFDSIATTSVGAGGASSITFSSIPSIYKHLQIRAIARSTSAGTGEDSIYAHFNSDTSSANYAYHILYGNGASATAGGAGQPQTGAWIAGAICDGATANNFSGIVIDILDYSNASKNKTLRGLYGFDNNGSGLVALRSSLWLSTAAVTQIDLKLSGNFKQYSHFALYGVK